MQKAEIKKDYVHYFKPATMTDYPKGFEHVLVTEKNVESVIALMEAAAFVVGDTETTGLDLVTAKVVGLSLCCEEDRSFYFPFRHLVGSEWNLSIGHLTEIHKRIFLKKETGWYNFPYDGQILENEGLDIENMKIFDVMNLVWLADTNWKTINLKWAEKHFLGWDAETFEQLLGGVQNIAYIHPNDCLGYACTDSLGTFVLRKRLLPELEKESGFVIKLDNKVCIPLIRAHQEDQFIDTKVLDEVERDLEEETPKVAQQIYALAGRQFDIDSPAQVARVLEELGIDTGERCKPNSKNPIGNLRTGADFLERVDHPIAALVIRYKQLTKEKGSFVDPMRVASRKEKRRFKYYICGVPTGRFKSGKDKESPDWFIPVNAQAILKPHITTRFAHKAREEESESVLGWVFSNVPSDLEVEYPEPRLNIRRAIAAPPGWLFISIDYSGQELRIPANLSGEPTWIKAFKDGVDLHSLVSQEMFGDVNKDLRKKAKAANFGILYGATAYSHAKTFNVPQEEADQFFSSYKGKYRRLFTWIEQEQRRAQRMGGCFTAFGRPRRLHYWYSSSNPKVKAFARRSTVNSIVQGTAADIFRISFINMYNKVFKVYPDVCKVRLVVHDEIDFILREDRVDLLDQIVKVLTVSRKDWPVVMEVGVEIGRSWGDMVKFEQKDGVWTPVPK